MMYNLIILSAAIFVYLALNDIRDIFLIAKLIKWPEILWRSADFLQMNISNSVFEYTYSCYQDEIDAFLQQIVICDET